MEGEGEVVAAKLGATTAITPSDQLSENFTLNELLRSDMAERHHGLRQQQFNPLGEGVDNLRYLVATTLQPIREHLGFPLHVTSGYRCSRLNKLIGGKASSQHCQGEAADCTLSSRFLTDPATESTRDEIMAGYWKAGGQSLDCEPTGNFYLWLLCCLNLESLDIDQVIHEYGGSFGQPAWVHISASLRQSRRQIVVVGDYMDGKIIRLDSLGNLLTPDGSREEESA